MPRVRQNFRGKQVLSPYGYTGRHVIPYGAEWLVAYRDNLKIKAMIMRVEIGRKWSC